MKPQKQKFLQDEAAGTTGDCGRAVLACLLDLDVEEVPHFGENLPQRFSGVEYNRRENEWLRGRGLYRVKIVFDGELSVDRVIRAVSSNNPDLLFLLVGTSKNETTHVVVCGNNKIVHDTALDDSGIVGPEGCGFYFVEFLVPLWHLIDRTGNEQALKDSQP